MDTYVYDIGAILFLVQGWSNQGLKGAFCRLFQNWVFKVDLGTHLRHKHGHLYLWDLQLFWPSFKLGETKVENIYFCQLSQNWVLKVDLGTHLRDKHGHLFLWDLDLFFPRLRLVKPRLKIFTFVKFLGIEILKWI